MDGLDNEKTPYGLNVLGVKAKPKQKYVDKFMIDMWTLYDFDFYTTLLKIIDEPSELSEDLDYILNKLALEGKVQRIHATSKVTGKHDVYYTTEGELARNGFEEIYRDFAVIKKETGTLMGSLRANYLQKEEYSFTRDYLSKYPLLYYHDAPEEYVPSDEITKDDFTSGFIPWSLILKILLEDNKGLTKSRKKRLESMISMLKKVYPTFQYDQVVPILSQTIDIRTLLRKKGIL